MVPSGLRAPPVTDTCRMGTVAERALPEASVFRVPSAFSTGTLLFAVVSSLRPCSSRMVGKAGSVSGIVNTMSCPKVLIATIKLALKPRPGMRLTPPEAWNIPAKPRVPLSIPRNISAVTDNSKSGDELDPTRRLPAPKIEKPLESIRNANPPSRRKYSVEPTLKASTPVATRLKELGAAWMWTSRLFFDP